MFSGIVFRFKYLGRGGLLNTLPEIPLDYRYRIGISPDNTAEENLFEFYQPGRKKKGGKTYRKFHLLHSSKFCVFDFLKVVGVCHAWFFCCEKINIHQTDNQLVKGGDGREILLTSEKEVISS